MQYFIFEVKSANSQVLDEYSTKLGFQHMTQAYAKNCDFLKKILLSRNADDIIKKCWLYQN